MVHGGRAGPDAEFFTVKDTSQGLTERALNMGADLLETLTFLCATNSDPIPGQSIVVASGAVRLVGDAGV